MSTITDEIKSFLLNEILTDLAENELTGSTKLVGEGFLDSLGVVKLIVFLESRYGVAMAASEITSKHIGTLDLLVQLVESKLGRNG